MRGQLNQNLEKELKQLNKLEKLAWVVFALIGIGYIMATVLITNH